MNDDAPPRYIGPTNRNALSELLGLANHTWMQDWPLEVANPTRVREFCELYAAGTLPPQQQFALMQLIVFSLDDALSIINLDDAELQEAQELAEWVESLLRRDFRLHLHTIDYWRRGNEDYADLPEEDLFPVTPMMRRIWADCFKPEYERWLSYPPQ